MTLQLKLSAPNWIKMIEEQVIEKTVTKDKAVRLLRKN